MPFTISSLGQFPPPEGVPRGPAGGELQVQGQLQQTDAQGKHVRRGAKHTRQALPRQVPGVPFNNFAGHVLPNRH